MNETWEQLKARHLRERRDLLQSLNEQGYTQTEAAAKLEMPMRLLNSYVIKYGIVWNYKRQGGKPHVGH